MNDMMHELGFWILFFLLNGLHYVINYVLSYKTSSFWPYITSIKENRKIGLVSNRNLDPFRYSVELSILFLLSRIVDLAGFTLQISLLYLLLFVFNFYQYTLRKIYHAEPVLYNDLRLLKNGISIVWNESKSKVLLALLLVPLVCIGVVQFFHWFLARNYAEGTNLTFYFLSSAWCLNVLYSIIKLKGFYKHYPNDLFLRNHFTVIEVIVNIKRSFENYRFSKVNLGGLYRDARKNVRIETNSAAPNIFFFLIESYGSYYFKEPSIMEESNNAYTSFENTLRSFGYGSVSSFSTSTTTGGQSWLAYSSLLYGYRMDNNTLFENHLYDEVFRNSNSLLKVLQNSGYTNYNLNPINPIEGIQVPYEEMRQMYTIDKWLLNNDIAYKGDGYGFGACPPDQYSLNYTMELLKREQSDPYTLFYLTKNSHSPFLVPEMENDWKKLSNGSSQIHTHKGFLKYPQLSDYQKAIKYEYDVIQEVVSKYGKADDIYVIIGDHQPPMLAKTETYGYATPAHIFSQNEEFLHYFTGFGFNKNISEASETLRHESFYSIFLNAYAKCYAIVSENIPAYEAKGVQLN